MTVELTDEECRRIEDWAAIFCRESYNHHLGLDDTDIINGILAKLGRGPVDG